MPMCIGLRAIFIMNCLSVGLVDVRMICHRAALLLIPRCSAGGFMVSGSEHKLRDLASGPDAVFVFAFSLSVFPLFQGKCRNDVQTKYIYYRPDSIGWGTHMSVEIGAVRCDLGRGSKVHCSGWFLLFNIPGCIIIVKYF